MGGITSKELVGENVRKDVSGEIPLVIETRVWNIELACIRPK